MADEAKSPRVLRRDTSARASAQAHVMRELEANAETFSDTLSNGRTVTLREMTAGDLLFLEKSLGNAGDMERSMKLAARLSCGEGRMSYDDMQKLNMKDLKVITALLADAGQTEDEEDDEDVYPNE